MKAFLTAATLVVATLTPALADGVEIDEPRLFKAFGTAPTAAGYFEMTNTGTEDDMLIGVSMGDLHAMLHETREADGVARMVHVDAVELPAGETVSFARGGLHVMVMGLTGDDLPLDSDADVTLVFERAGAIEVAFPVTSDVEDGS